MSVARGAALIALLTAATLVVPGSAITPEQIREAAEAAHDWLKAQQYTEEDVGKVAEYRWKDGSLRRYRIEEADVGALPNHWKDWGVLGVPVPFGGVGLEYVLRAAEAGFPVDETFVERIVKNVWGWKCPLRGEYSGWPGGYRDYATSMRREDPNGEWAYWVQVQIEYDGDRVTQREEHPSARITAENVTAFCMAYKLGFIPEDEWKREYEPFIEKAVRWLMEGPYLTRGTRADTGHLPTPRPWTITTSSTRPGPA